jgi:sulfur-carrier protein
VATVTLVYFAWVRERMGCDSESVAVPDNVATIADLIDWLAARNGHGAAAFGDAARIRAARDGEMALPGTAIAEAREIALFPPVTGG